MSASPSRPFSMSSDDGLGTRLLEATLNAATDGIIVMCSNSIIRLFSRGAEQMFGYDSDEVVGQSINVLLPESQHEQHRAYIERYLETGKRQAMGISRRIQAVDHEGNLFPIHLSLGEFKSGDEQMFVGIARDMRALSNLESELDEERQKSRRLQRRLDQVYQSSVLSELVASIAHEVNQPLAAITTYADVSRRVLKDNSTEIQSIESNLHKIALQALRAGDVIQQLRDLVPISQGISESTRVGDFIIELMDIIHAEAREAQCEVRVQLDGELPMVRANPTQIQHVLLLLLRNSLESFSDRAGHENRIVISGKQHSNDFVQLAVTDNGSGIEEVILDTLYHPFTSNKADKMGIGLSICSTIVSNHGGRIWHESNAKGGSRFIFTLPVHTG